MGFTSTGIAASSIAAKMMSSAAIANGGGVAAGSLVATLQSVGRCPEQEEGGMKGRIRARMGFSPESKPEGGPVLSLQLRGPRSLVLCLPSAVPSFGLRGGYSPADMHFQSTLQNLGRPPPPTSRPQPHLEGAAGLSISSKILLGVTGSSLGAWMWSSSKNGSDKDKK
ncbi:hypothetical protein QTO34_020123 [Cnephaeus nilssonii]|uniref:Uncharacterized protein n=1 Tax=Cnephaeus nilssonii TaxID=3371016 RepID=A0AA40HYP9_CNENI|nr:hypothetical protein QTO34_020123 [Eptesicus nilssonii]